MPSAMQYAVSVRLSDYPPEMFLANRRWSEEDVGLVEEGKADGISFPNIERLAFSIGLDESQIAFNPQVTSIAGRLKTMQDEAPGLGLKSLSSTAVSVLTEAASVIRTQTELQEALQVVGAGFVVRIKR